MKFFNLLKKELRELISAQLIIGLVVSAAVLLMLGGIMGNAMDEATSQGGSLTICDQDDTEFTRGLLAKLEEAGYSVHTVAVNEDDRAALMAQLNTDSLLILPQGFTAQVLDTQNVGQLERICVLKNASVMSTLSDTTGTALSYISAYATDRLMTERGMSAAEAAQILQPITTKDVTVVADKSAEISSTVLVSFLSSQGIIVPIIIFMLVMYTSQMILTAVSTEKIDKTLETLLSAPVSRLSVIGAKMLAAAIVALLNALVYMFGFSSYIGTVLSAGVDSATLTNSLGEALTMQDILNQLGVSLTAGSYVLIGLQMFLTILIALCVSMMLGALATDVKSAQTLLMPMMICAMVPYLISMTSDINSLPAVLRTIIYAIPFTHTFSAMSNIMFGNDTAFWLGFAYQLVFFIVCLAAVLYIFTSDKIFTVSLTFAQKRKFKKNTHNET